MRSCSSILSDSSRYCKCPGIASTRVLPKRHTHTRGAKALDGRATEKNAAFISQMRPLVVRRVWVTEDRRTRLPVTLYGWKGRRVKMKPQKPFSGSNVRFAKRKQMMNQRSTPRSRVQVRVRTFSHFFPRNTSHSKQPTNRVFFHILRASKRTLSYVHYASIEIHNHYRFQKCQDRKTFQETERTTNACTRDTEKASARSTSS